MFQPNFDSRIHRVCSKVMDNIYIYIPANVKKPRDVAPVTRVDFLDAPIDIFYIAHFDPPLKRKPHAILLWALKHAGAVADGKRAVEATGERQHLFRVWGLGFRIWGSGHGPVECITVSILYVYHGLCPTHVM